MIRDRAMKIHGRVCAIETRGPKHSLILSVYREHNGTTYEIRRGIIRKGEPILRALAATLCQMEVVKPEPL